MRDETNFPYREFQIIFVDISPPKEVEQNCPLPERLHIMAYFQRVACGKGWKRKLIVEKHGKYYPPGDES